MRLVLSLKKMVKLDIYNLTATPLNRLKEPNLRPAPETIEKVNNLMF